MSTEQNRKKESPDSTLPDRIKATCVQRNKENQACAEQIMDILFRLGVDEQGQVTGYIHGLWPLSDDELRQVESIMGTHAIQLYHDVDRMVQLSDMLAPDRSGLGA